MAHPNKLITAATLKLNPYGVRVGNPGTDANRGYDRLPNAFALCETSGTTLLNIGLAPSSEHPSLTGSLVGTVAFVASGNDAPYLTFDVASGNNYARFAPSATTTLARGQMTMRCKYSGSVGVTHSLWNNGFDATTTGALAITGKNSTVTITARIDGADRTLTFLDTGGLRGLWFNLTWWWNELGWGGFLQTDGHTGRVAGVPSAALTIGWKTDTTLYCYMGADSAGTTTGIVSVASWFMHDTPLYSIETETVLNDAYQPFREVPNRDGVLCIQAAPIVGRVKTTSAWARFKAGLGDVDGPTGVLAHDKVCVRLRHASATDALMAATPGDWVKTTDHHDVRAILEVPITGCTSGVPEYYWWEWSVDDGVTALPTPGPIGRFVPRKTAGSAKAHFSTDGHEGKLTEYDSAVEGFGLAALDGGEQAFMLWQACHDEYVHGTHDFHINHGDFLMCVDAAEEDKAGNSDISYKAMRQAASAWNRTYLRALAGAVYCVPGNHEVPRGPQQKYLIDASYHAIYKQALRTWMEFTNNPLPGDYDEGCEDQGAPTTTSSQDWVPGLDTEYDAAWRTEWLIPVYPTSHGLPPTWCMGTYWAFTWAGALFMCGDSLPYSAVGNIADRNGSSETYGIRQRGQFGSILEETTAVHKVFSEHQPPASSEGEYRPPEGYYWRITNDNCDVGCLAGWFGKYGLTARCSGHNHSAAHNKDPVTHFNNFQLPSSCLPTFANASGVHSSFTNISSMLGTPESNGATLFGGAAGTGTAIGNVWRQHVCGYAILRWSDTGPMTLSIRQTGLLLTNSTTGEPKFDLQGPRQIGPTYTPAPAGYVTLTETPSHIGFAITASDLAAITAAEPDGAWWAHTGLYADHNMAATDPPGAYVLDQDHTSTLVAIAPGTAADVLVKAVPREWSTDNLTNAVPPPMPEAAKVLCPPHLFRRGRNTRR